MDTPICLSQNFVNKLNVRSFSNIIRSKLLKIEDSAPFLQDLIEDKNLVSQLSVELLKIISVLKGNLRAKSKTDFKEYFSSISREKAALCPINKDAIFNSCWNAIVDILPKSFFGGNHNIKIFKKIVQTIIYSMRRQHVKLREYIEKWEFSSLLWQSLLEDIRKTILTKIVLWIVKNVLSSMICLNFYVTTAKLDADENKLHFFWKSQWQSFYDKKVSDLIFSRVLRRFESYCLGKKAKRKHDLSERLKIKSLKKDIPKLHLVLKPNNDYRPIVRYKTDQTSTEKYKFKERVNFLKTLTGKPHKKIESQFNTIYEQWVNTNMPKLYFVKTDLSNAFGSINRAKLTKILSEQHMEFQRTEKNPYMKKKFAQQFQDVLTELRRPLLVRAGNTVYEWNEGLVQGYKYSPALSELYYTYHDKKYFVKHLYAESEAKLFIRVVDDYLYITNSLEDAHSFLNALSNYRNVNYEKTVVNFEHENIQCKNEITFLGYSYNTQTMQVSRASNVFIGQMCYKIAFTSSLEKMNKFLENRIGQSGIQINSHIFNFRHNTEELIWHHIFTTFCLSANKFCTILAVQCQEREMKSYLKLYKLRVVVKLSNSILQTLMKTKPIEFIFAYCINHFRYLSFKALQLCAKRTPKCSGLVPLINNELAKTDCLFGKWREHACRIETNGEMRRPAIRAICRRDDLKKIVKTFETLPQGFECYDQRKLM